MNARAARTWAHRWAVEEFAHAGFLRIADALQDAGYPDALIDEATAAARDEADHARRCRDLAILFGGKDEAPTIDERPELAPPGMPTEERLLYEAVARCCIAETESAATLAELAGHTKDPVRDTVRAIARDEVRHARLGWAVLSFAKHRRDVAFLGPHLPAMLEPGGSPLWDWNDAPDEPDLPELGVFSIATRRAIFRDTLTDVILPAFDALGVPTEAAREWLARQEARRPADPPSND